MATVRDRLAALDTEAEKLQRRLALEREVYSALPPELTAPTVSNEQTKFFDRPGVWLSWSAPLYGEPTISGSDILSALEQAGFTPMPVTVCKWADWRVIAEPGAAEDIPDTKHRDTLKDITPAAPLWIVPEQHTGTKACAFYERGGRVFKVSVPGPSRALVTARRKEIHGTWYYERGTARLSFPESWHAVRTADGESVAGISQHSRAYVDTEQGISGAIYFEPYTEQDAFPLTPAGMLRVLEETAVTEARNV